MNDRLRSDGRPTRSETVLIVDDDDDVQGALEMVLGAEGYDVRFAHGGPQALELLRRERPHAMVLDLNLPGMTGFEVLEACHSEGLEVATVVISGMNDVDSVVRAMKLGAIDYVAKPIEAEELTLILARAVAAGAREPSGTTGFDAPASHPEVARAPAAAAAAAAPAAAQAAAAAPGGSNPAWFGGGQAMRHVWELARKISDTDVPVLITGESGVGKDVITRAIQHHSSRRDQLLVKVNCAALPATLLESELFGHEQGAFTGATRERAGKFELAHKGTIFLDEIAEMPVDLQAKLLQALQDGIFYRVGGKKPVEVDVRVIAATNRNLDQAMREGKFREDLYFRLNVVHISVPPLRARRDEVLPLIEFFLRKHAGRYRTPDAAPSMPAPLRQKLLAYSWPGNVRQLENIIRRWVVLRDERYVLEELDAQGPGEGTPDPRATQADADADACSASEEPRSLLEIGRRAAREAEKIAIQETLIRTGWNKRRAAAELQVSYKALLYKIKESGIISPHAAAAAAAMAAPRSRTLQ